MRYAAPQILVVDSDVAHAASCLMMLEREGFDVTCAHDFAAAWTALKRRLPAAVLADSVIEGGDAELVVREATRRSVPTVLMTEIAVGDVNERYFRSLGAAAQWEKPLRRGDVVDTLRQLLGDEYPDDAALAADGPTQRPTAAANDREPSEPAASQTRDAQPVAAPEPPTTNPDEGAATSLSAVLASDASSRGDAADTFDIPAPTAEVRIAPDDSDPTGAYHAASESEVTGESQPTPAPERASSGPEEEPFDWDVDPMLAELSAGDFVDTDPTRQQGNEPTAVTQRPVTPPPVGVAPPSERLEDIAAAVASDFGTADEMSDTDFEGLRPAKSSGPVVVAGAVPAETPPPTPEALYFHLSSNAQRGRVGEPMIATLLTRAEKLRRTGVLELVLPDAALSIALTSGDVSGVRVAGEGDPAVAALREDGVLRPDQWEALLRGRGKGCTLAELVQDGVVSEHDALEAAHVGIARAMAAAWFATEGDWAWRDGAQDVPQAMVSVPPAQLVWRACLHGVSQARVTRVLEPLNAMAIEVDSSTPRLPLTRAAVAQFALAASAAPQWAAHSEVGERLLLWCLITDHVRLR